MKAKHSIRTERIAAFLTLILASALVTYATTAASAPQVPATPKVKLSQPLRGTSELLQPIETISPLNGTIAVRPAAKKLSTVLASPRTHTIRMEVTGYCQCRECCGPRAQGLTASGRPVSFNRGKFVAADTDLLPFGTKVLIPGYNHDRPVPVADRGGAIQGRRLDLFFPTHAQAQQWGRQWITVTVVD